MGYSTQQDNNRSKGSNKWLWLLPLGCLGSLVVLGGGIAGLIVLLMSFMRSNGATQGALERLQSNPQAIDALGEPIKMGWLLSGSINISGPSGNASLSIPVSGPRGSGTLYVEAEKQAGEWQYERLELGIDGRTQRIDLLPILTFNPQWQLPETSSFLPVFVTNPTSNFEVQLLPKTSY